MKSKLKIQLKWLVFIGGLLLILSSYLISTTSNIEYLLEIHSEIAGVGVGMLVVSIPWILLGRRVNL